MPSDNIFTPVGHLISGSLTEKVTTDFDGHPLPPEKQNFQYGVAFRKDDPGTSAMIQAVAAQAYADFSRQPNIQAIIGQYNFAPKSGFSWKIKDGDLPNAKGEFNENARGCYVLYFSSNYPTKCGDENSAEISPDQVYRGCYIDMIFTCAGNDLSGDRAGIYLNPQGIRRVAHGKPIVGGIDLTTAFAGRAIPSQLPPGASATPVAAGPLAAPAAPAAPGFPSPAAPTPPAAPSTTGFPGNAPVAPHPTFAAGPGAPVAPTPPALPGFPGT
jgi:hypothetical protein